MTAARRIDVAQAAELIFSRMPVFPAVAVPLADAAGAVLRETIHAERDQPPFNRVTMDGIAVRSDSLAAGKRRWRVAGTQGAGADAIALTDDGACVEIMTGAMLPADADTVIPVERVTREGDDAVLQAGYLPDPGQFVHRQGSDHTGGQQLLEPGQRLGPAEMAVLTISGQDRVKIARWPRIAVISTGSELVEPGQPLAAFQVRSSNDLAIAAALGRRGPSDVVRARLPDEPDALKREIASLHDENEILVLSGGVSMGKYDYVPKIMEELGVELVFHKILQRPGLPMWFGISADGKPVFALPGNPVSSLVCAVRYVARGDRAGPRRQARATAATAAGQCGGLRARPHVVPAGARRARRGRNAGRNTLPDQHLRRLRQPRGHHRFRRAAARPLDHYPAGFTADLYWW